MTKTQRVQMQFPKKKGKMIVVKKKRSKNPNKKNNA
jgi:hypothetical protein